MAEDKRANPYPYPTAEEIAAAPGTREQKAARFIATRRMGGIPIRGFLLGENDRSPMMQGITDLTTVCYKVLDEFAEVSNAYRVLVELRDILETGPCVPAKPEE